MPVFNIFPAIQELGAKRLQSLCDLWRQTAMAEEFGITKLVVTTENNQIFLGFTCQITHSVKDGAETGFPIDDLLFYIADNGIVDPSKRQELKSDVIAFRKRHGPAVFRKFTMRPGPKLPIFITCKNPECQNVMVTNLRHYRAETFVYNPSDLECTRCHKTYTYDHNDYHFGPNA